MLRLPAASRQQPAWLRRAPLWRRTTRCSGMPLRPSPRQSDLAQPDWTLEAHTATTLRRISPLAKSGTAAALWLPAASSQPGCGAHLCGGERPGAAALHHAHHHANPTWHYLAGRWPLAAGSPHSHDTSTHLTSGEVGDGGGNMATSGQSPAWLRRAPLWRRTTRCSGTPSRPSPRHSHLAQPGWPLAAGSSTQDPRGLRPTPHGWPVQGAPSARHSPCARSGPPSRSATSSSRWAGREHGPSHATGPGRAPPPTA